MQVPDDVDSATIHVTFTMPAQEVEFLPAETTVVIVPPAKKHAVLSHKK